MKKLTLIFFVCSCLLAGACGNGENDANDDDTATMNQSPAGPAPDNSSATNPSVPDSSGMDTVPH